MTNRLDWSSHATALSSAVATASGSVAQNGQAILDALNAAGSAYDILYAATGVDAAKGAWITATNAAWLPTVAIAREIVVHAGGTDPGGLSLDFYHRDSFDALVAKASSADATRASLLASALSAVDALWDVNGDGDAYTGATFVVTPARYLVADLTLGNTLFVGNVPNFTVIEATRTRTADSVRHVELALDALVDSSIAWIAALGGP